MSQRRIVTVLSLAFLLVTAGCLGGVQAASGDGESPGRSIDVSASETLYAAPDEAVLHLAVETTGSSASDVRAALDTAAADLTSSLEDAGVGAENITTANYGLSVVRNPDTSTVEYRGVHAFRVTTTEVDAVGRLVDVALANGANRVSSIQFTLSEDARTALYRDALAAALASARGDATVLAAEAGHTVGDARQISASHVQYYGGWTAASTEIRVSEVAVTAQVSVTFAAE